MYTFGSAIILVLMSIFIKEGNSIECWECNSLFDPRCGEAFDNRTLATVDCSQQERPHLQGKAGYCRKIIQNIQGKIRTVRACGWLEDPRTVGGRCYSRTGTKDIIVTFCQCDRNKCNSGTILSYSTGFVAILLIVGQLF